MEITQYSTEALQAVTGAQFLVKEDWSALSEMQSELQDTYEKQQMWRTETEIRVSVLNDMKHPTNGSKYWQAVREQAVFFEQLVMLSFEYRRNDLEIKRLERDMVTIEDEIELAEKQIDLEECQYKRKNMQLGAKNRMRELKLWSQIKAELDDGSFNNQDVNEHQLKSYLKAWDNEARCIGPHTAPAEKRNILGRLDMAAKEYEKNKLLT